LPYLGAERLVRVGERG
jgi:hypothetical protein